MPFFVNNQQENLTGLSVARDLYGLVPTQGVRQAFLKCC